MATVDFSKLIPAYDFNEGGSVYAKYMQLYEDFINEVISSNDDIYTIFNGIDCADKYLPYLASFLGYTWDYNGDIEKQRYELLSIVNRRKRIGTVWYLDDMFMNLGVTVEYKDLVHHVLTLSGPETLDGDYYLQGLEKYHEGSVEVIVHSPTPIPGLYDMLINSMPAGVHIHLTYV